MGADLLSLESDSSWTGLDARQQSVPYFDVVMQATMHADPRRIFHALTMPEYVETWMTLPEQQKGSFVVAMQRAKSFRIDFYRQNMLDASVTGSFRIQQLDKLIFTWRRFGELDDAQSIVTILLQGGAGRCVLELRHTGLRSHPESHWHRQLWSASLRNLARLF
jgi:uncharacterized protein YndB with AHSA1/START domain